MGKSNYRRTAFALCMMYPGTIPSTKSQVKYKTEMSYLDKVKDERLTKTMNANWKNYYDVIKKISTLTGQWPYQRPITRYVSITVINLSIYTIVYTEVIVNSQ